MTDFLEYVNHKIDTCKTNYDMRLWQDTALIYIACAYVVSKGGDGLTPDEMRALISELTDIATRLYNNFIDTIAYNELKALKKRMLAIYAGEIEQ